jgi:hypothetical protein
MSDKKDWNTYFAKLKAERDLERSHKLSNAKAAAAHTDKEPWSARRFTKLYKRLNPSDVDKLTPWKTLIEESEYDYYVAQTDITNLEEYVKHLKWLQGFG